MKLRNKKTGKVFDVIVREKSNGDGEYSIIVRNLRAIRSGRSVSSILGEYNSLAKLYEDWEDYKPAEPLIKDEKIRKAVRAWAEINNVPTDLKLDVFEYLGTGVTVIRYLYNAKTLPHKRCVQFEYISSDEIYTSQNDRECTITELCGEEEECEGDDAL